MTMLGSVRRQAVTEAAQHVIERNGRHTGGDAMQVTHGGRDQVRRHLHCMQDRFGAEQQQ